MATCYDTRHAMAVWVFPLGGIVSIGIRIPPERVDSRQATNTCFDVLKDYYKATFRRSLSIWSFVCLILYKSTDT